MDIYCWKGGGLDIPLARGTSGNPKQQSRGRLTTPRLRLSVSDSSTSCKEPAKGVTLIEAARKQGFVPCRVLSICTRVHPIHGYSVEYPFSQRAKWVKETVTSQGRSWHHLNFWRIVAVGENI